MTDLSRRVLDRLQTVPGIESVSFTHSGFGTGISRTCCLAVAGYDYAQSEDRQIRTLGVAPGYFQTMRLPLVRGRGFAEQDARSDPESISVVIVNEVFARRYLDGRDPIGARLGWGDPPNATYGFEIIGVVTDAVHEDIREDVGPLIYLPFSWGDTFIARLTASPGAIMTSLLREANAVDPNLDVSIRAVADVLEAALVREKLLSTLSILFGALATLLAAVGLYGLIAYTVMSRTREIAVRMALGAPQIVVLRSELRTAIQLVATGITLGVPVALASGRMIESQLFGSSADPLTLGAAGTLLVAVAIIAALVPARRALRVDPIIALRSD